jgi:hypothetical protein
MSKTPDNKDKDSAAVKDAVSKNIPALTAAALSSAIGSMYILEMTTTETGRIKYVPVQTVEKIIQAIEWISEHGNKFEVMGEKGFFILQQRPPDSKFWETLVSRYLGRIPEEQRVEVSHKIDLTKLGQKAAQYTIHNQKELAEPIPSSWLN